LWLISLGCPLVFLVTLAEAQPNDAWKDSFGRLAFVAGQLLLVVTVLWAGRQSHGGLQKLFSQRPGSWIARLSYPICLGLAAIPFALALLAGAGYYYTALRLAGRMQATLWLVMGLVIGQALAARWLNSVYRGLAIKSAVRKVEGDDDDDAADLGPSSEIDLEKIDNHTHRLLHSTMMLALVVGLCVIWIDVLPALRFFNQITLWSDPGIDPAHPITVTLENLLEAAIVAVMTIVAASNLPSLLEIVLLERLPLDNGVRYALSAVARYFIAIVGLALAGNSVGIGWPKMQWLAAAISFGLGFGLQEIFANFVSGLIVLCERPARIGDTVTVGDVTGVVSRIQMRATTIVDADRKELIVPNKEFITGRLVNWTLSDSVVRVVVRLGLAYGTDPRQAQRIMMRVASETTDVLKNPPPSAVLVGFSEKTLDFELRVFVGTVEALMPVRHRLNTQIEHAFRASGIEFATPPRETSARPVSPTATAAPSRSQAA
jgi:potassium efflux system protein